MTTETTPQPAKKKARRAPVPKELKTLQNDLKKAKKNLQDFKPGASGIPAEHQKMLLDTFIKDLNHCYDKMNRYYKEGKHLKEAAAADDSSSDDEPEPEKEEMKAPQVVEVST